MNVQSSAQDDRELHEKTGFHEGWGKAADQLEACKDALRGTHMTVQRISPCLWFDGDAAEAVAHYLSIFDNSRILSGGGMTIVFELEGVRFIALNGGPMFRFNEAVSMSVACADQAEVDHYWDRLVEGGTPSRCGWLKDRFGLSWQIVPNALGSFLGGDDAAGAKRAMQAMMGMGKLDIAELERAYNG